MWSKTIGLVAAISLVCFIAYVDYLAGAGARFSIFYLIPIALVVWRVGRTAGIVVAGVSAIAWLFDDILGGHPFPTSLLPYWDATMRLGFFLIIVWLLSGRKRAEVEREKLIAELQEALASVKTLRGMLPICMSCKKVRDDKGYWNQIESYIRSHSEAAFSHSICPECEKKLYSELAD